MCQFVAGRTKKAASRQVFLLSKRKKSEKKRNSPHRMAWKRYLTKVKLWPFTMICSRSASWWERDAKSMSYAEEPKRTKKNRENNKHSYCLIWSSVGEYERISSFSFVAVRGCMRFRAHSHTIFIKII